MQTTGGAALSGSSLQQTRSVSGLYWALAIALLVPVGFLIYSLLVAPRPYYLFEMDIEPDYYYNARLIYSGLPVGGIHHPGTPIYYLGAAIMWLTGSDLSATQTFFNIGYVIVAVVTVAALGWFAYVALRGVPFGVALLVLASIVAWPPFLTYLNNFGAESFVVAAGVPTITLLWLALASRTHYRMQALALSAVGAGLCLAIKLTFFPMAAALVIAGSVHIIAVARNRRASGQAGGWLRPALGRLLVMPAALLAAHIVFTLPILERLLLAWRGSFNRPDARPPSGNIFSPALRTFSHLFEAAPFVAALLALVAAALVIGVVVYFYRGVRRARGTTLDSEPDDFDYLPAIIFLIIMLFAFIYTLAARESARDALQGYIGVRLRNVSPSALFAPFAILLCYRLLVRRAPEPEPRARSSAVTARLVPQLALALVSLAVIAAGLAAHILWRQSFIDTQLAASKTTTERLSAFASPGVRTAFWTGAAHDLVGEASFHFWGNYRYAYNRFDSEILDHYPQFTMFQLRSVVDRMSGRNEDEVDSPSGGSRLGVIGDMYWSFNHYLQSLAPDYKFSQEDFTGQSAGVKVGMLAYPQSEGDIELASLPSSDSASDFFSALNGQLGALLPRQENIAGTEWVLIDVPKGASNSR